MMQFRFITYLSENHGNKKKCDVCILSNRITPAIAVIAPIVDSGSDWDVTNDKRYYQCADHLDALRLAGRIR